MNLLTTVLPHKKRNRILDHAKDPFAHTGREVTHGLVSVSVETKNKY